jgi:DNA-binding CsgD family transcriptional regulator
VVQALLERDAEVAALAARLDGARTGGGALVVVEGPAGIGKTSLLAAAARAARERDMTVLHARGAPLEQTFSFGIARQLLEPVRATCRPPEWAELTAGAAALAARALEAAADDGGRGDDAAHATVHGLFWLVANLAARRPALVVVDDAHWADPPSLRWLAHLTLRLEGLPLLLAVAVRAGEPSSDRRLLDDLLAAATEPPLRPRPLGRPAAATVVRAHFAGPVEDGFCDACHAATGGNPFLLGALIASLRAEGVAPRREAAPTIESFGPEAVARALARQLERLPAGAVELARAAALLADAAPLRRAAALAGLEPLRANRVADALRAAGVLAPTTRLEFVHPVVRAAIYASLGPGERGLWHERAARLLRAEGAEPERVATHLLRTEPIGAADTLTVLRAAAQDASARGAPETAAVYLRRALDEGHDPDSRPGVLLELGLALAAHAQPGAAELLREAAEVATEPAARAAAGLRGARALGMAGRFAEARTVCRAALSQSAGMPPEAVARLEAELIPLARLTAATVEEARERLHRPTIEPPPLELWRVHTALGDTFAGRPARDVLALLRPVLTAGALAAEPDSMLLDETVLVLLCNDELDTARALCDEIAATARPRGWLTTLVHASFLGSMVALRSGAAREAEADARFAFDSMIAANVPPAALMWGLFPLADAHVERDASDAAEDALTAAGLAEPLPGELGAPLTLEARARLRCAQGRYASARDDLLEAARRWEALGIRHPGIAAWRADAATALAAVGETTESERLAREHLALAERVGTPGALGAALRAVAVTAPRAQAITLLERAVEILAPSPMRLEHTRALCDLGAALRRAGHRREARDPLRHALDLAERDGLACLARRAREELTAAGARPRRAALSGPGALTAAEHRVAALAASGHTNREIAQQLFVTQRTVETHLSHAFQKLDIHSRDRLAAALWPVDPQEREIARDAAPQSTASPAGANLAEPRPAPTLAAESTIARAHSASEHTAWRGSR